jgi:2-polyprenyl-3-methyl-5-hydroxy-6-metoxy-1,4-benzoquinol methylase
MVFLIQYPIKKNNPAHIMNYTQEKFNEKRYANHQALVSINNFYTDKVYLSKILKEITKRYDNNHNNKVLELGCADGSFSSLLKKKGFDVYAIDISASAIEKAKQTGIKAEVGNLEERINHNEDYFDIVIATEVIEHLYDTDFFLKEIKRVMKKNGHLFLSTPNLASLKNRIKLLFGAYPQYMEYRLGPEQAGHIRAYTPDILRKQIKDNGFDVIRVMSPNILFPMTSNSPLFVKKIAILLGDIFYNIGSHIIIIARKS